MSEEDYQKQLELSSLKYSADISFTPEDENYYIDNDNTGYDFLTSYEANDYVDIDLAYEEPERPTMDTLWTKCASLRDDPMLNLIYLNYWNDTNVQNG